MKRLIHCTLCFGLIGLLAGCSPETPNSIATKPSEADSAALADGSKFLLSAEPEGATNVIQVRQAANDGDLVVIQGRIGGSNNPWIENRAAFSIVDPSLKACNDIEGDNCPIPWDYCCETDKLPTSTALVKMVDSDGALIKQDARKLLNVKELSTVVVQGKALRDDTGNLTILASGIFVKTQ